MPFDGKQKQLGALKVRGKASGNISFRKREFKRAFTLSLAELISNVP